MLIENAGCRFVKLIILTLIVFMCKGINAQELSSYPSLPPIKIGMTTALSGPVQALGQEVKRGIEVYFAKVNALGGIEGRKLKLIALDDEYEPMLAGPNMRRLINEGVLAVIGNVGTPTGIVTTPIANEYKVLLFAPFSGAKVFRKVPPRSLCY